MIFNKINSKKYYSLKAILSCFLITSFITTFSSCMTTSETFYATPDTLSAGSLKDINKLILKNGKVIEFGDKTIEAGRDSNNALFFFIWLADNPESQDGNGQNVVNWTKERIPASDILKIKLEKSTVNIPISLLVIGGSILILGIILYAASGKSHSGGWHLGEF